MNASIDAQFIGGSTLTVKFSATAPSWPVYIVASTGGMDAGCTEYTLQSGDDAKKTSWDLDLSKTMYIKDIDLSKMTYIKWSSIQYLFIECLLDHGTRIRSRKRQIRSRFTAVPIRQGIASRDRKRKIAEYSYKEDKNGASDTDHDGEECLICQRTIDDAGVSGKRACGCMCSVAGCQMLLDGKACRVCARCGHDKNKSGHMCVCKKSTADHSESDKPTASDEPASSSSSAAASASASATATASATTKKLAATATANRGPASKKFCPE